MMPTLNLPAVEELAAPMVALNKISLNYTEKLVELNLSMLRKQADVMLGSWREALAIKNVEQVKEYLAHQGEVARGVVSDYMAEAKAVSTLSQEVANDVRKVVETSIANGTKMAA